MNREELATYLEEIDYAFDRLARDHMPGIHPSSIQGFGFQVRNYASLFDYPNFQMVDWIATAISGSKTPLVTVPEQKSAITVLCLADVTASLGFSGVGRKIEEMAKAIASLGFSAYKIGDRFAAIFYGEKIEEYFEPRSSRTYSLEIGEWLLGFTPTARNADGLISALDYVAEQPMMIFWLSDFNLPDEKLSEFLMELDGKHDVIPLIFWDSAEFEDIPRWGSGWLRDPESGEERMEIFTPWRSRAFRKGFEIKRQKLNEIFSSYNIKGVTLMNQFGAAGLAEFFLSRRS